jgi:hypothetical protein
MAGRAQRWPATKEAVLALIAPVLGRHATTVQAAAEFGCSDAALRGVCRNHGIAIGSLLEQSAYVPRAPATGPVASREPPFAVREPATLAPEPPAPPVIPVGRDLTVALAGDLHAPDIDQPAWTAFLRWTSETQPDVIVLNEMVEWVSMSRHGGNWGAMWDKDVASGRRVFAQVRSVNPNARIVCLETNHDTRVNRTVQDLLPSLVGRIVVPHELRLADMGIEWIPQKVAFRVGRLKVIHGHQLGSGFKGMLPENACKRAIQRYGEPGWTVVFFHTHRKGYWSERHDSGVYEAVNLPCLRTLAPDWLESRPAGWSHGFGVAYVGPAGQTNLYPVDIEGGAFTYGGKQYRAA